METDFIKEKLTQHLNPPQKEAVLHQEGPLLILAGAGSGKTRVLTHRMAALVLRGKAAVDEILCVTFTNKAAREMESRIYQLLSDLEFRVQGHLWISTFHSFCVRILKQHITMLDYKPFFSIYDSSDQLSLIKKVMQNLNINDKMYPAKNFQSRISSAKMNAQTPEQIQKSKHSLMDQKTFDVYKSYEIELKKANALDFDDLLLKTYDLFKMYPDLLLEYQKKFKYIMVDEYQDTNRIQYLLVTQLAQHHKNICVVGDEDQSIYSWRGADIKNILDFEHDFQNTKTVKLEENYRSSNNIVQAATAVIKNNLQRKNKTLFTSNKSGDLILVREEKNEYEEARFVVKKIQTMITEGEGNYSDYAVFYRTNSQSRVLEEQLRTQSIPYRLVGGVRFYERMEIKDVISYMKVTLNLNDDIAAKRIVNVPTRGIGKTTIEKVEDVALQNQLTFLQAIEKSIETRVFNAGTTSKLRRFLDLVYEIKNLSLNYKLDDFYHLILDKTQYLQALRTENTPEAEARIENLEEFDNAISQFIKERGEEATLQTFLEEMALVSDVDQLNQQVNSVTLMTLHISKGLEFPYVFIVGLEDGLFPSLRFEDSDADDMEEERRLAYVGMTRAREKLFLSYARQRKIWGQDQSNPPSRFLKEIPSQFIQFQTAPTVSSFGSSFVDKYAHRSENSFSQRPRGPHEFESQSFPDDDFSESGGRSGVASYQKGLRVRHPTFGLGSIFDTEGSGELLKVSVLFSDNTIKKFVVKYARLEVLK